MIVFLQKMSGKVVAELDIKECILASFKVQDDDVKTREAL
jgi:hypothetical protein